MNIYKKQRSKPLQKKKLLFLSMIVISIFVFLIGFLLILTTGKELSDLMVSMPFSFENKYFGMGQNIVFSEKEYLTCIDPSTNIVWQLGLFSDGLSFTHNDEIIVANSSAVIQTVNSNGQHHFSKQLDGTIVSTRAGKNKVAVYVQQKHKDSTLSYILVFDLSGTELFKIEVTERYILDYGFDWESNSLYLLEIDVSGSVPISRISTFRPETQSMTGIKELKDQLVSDIHIIGENIYALGTNHLTVYKSSLGSNDKSIMIYGWLLEDIYRTAEPKFVFIPANKEGYIDIARIIYGSGKEFSINMPPEVFDIIYENDKIYCFANKNIFVYTVDGKYERTFSFPFEISSIKRAFGKYVFVIQDSNVFLMQLP